jgi:hypothetical protein
VLLASATCAKILAKTILLANPACFNISSSNFNVQGHNWAQVKLLSKLARLKIVAR